MKVQIGFDLSANGVGDYFTLDDTTKGVLNNTTYVLGGNVLVDVTNDVRKVSVRRGRSRTLEKFTAGNATVVLDNMTNTGSKYDPTNLSSPYFGSIVPGKQVLIEHLDTPMYDGNVADWNFSYDVNGNAVAEPSSVDGLTYLAQQTLSLGTATSQLTGARVSAILDLANWPAAQRSIATGQATLDADVIPEGTNVLSYLEKVADISEPGALFVNRLGEVTFKDRSQLQNFSTGITFGGTAGVPYQGCEIIYGTEEMTNSVQVTYTAGSVVAGTAIAEDLASQEAYGTINQTYESLLSTSTQAQALANWQVGLYSQPRFRVDSIAVNLAGLSSQQAAQVLAVDLGDVVAVFPPNSSSSQIVSVDGIEHEADPQQHVVTFRMSEASAAFILDNPQFGTLDNNSLGF
jgi:hypothetical protein